MDLLGALAKESSNEEPAHPAIAIRAVGGEAEAVLLAWLRPPQGQGTEPFGPLGAEHPQQSVEMSDASASQQIDDIVRRTAGWRGERLSQLRALVRGADPRVIEEVKWKKPSRPEGVPVWSHDGIVCIGEALKNAVRLPRVPSKTAVLTGPISTGSCVNRTRASRNRLNSFPRSSTAKEVNGIPSSTRACLNGLAAGWASGSRTSSVPFGSSADVTVS